MVMAIRPSPTNEVIETPLTISHLPFKDIQRGNGGNRSLNHRHFITYLKKFDCKYDDLLLLLLGLGKCCTKKPTVNVLNNYQQQYKNVLLKHDNAAP